jgi:hypothetical protein
MVPTMFGISTLKKKDAVRLTSCTNDYCWHAGARWRIYRLCEGRRNPCTWYRRGGGGATLIGEPQNLKIIDPAVSADGRYIYYSARTGAWNYNARLPQYQLGVYDRENAKSRFSNFGSRFTKILSRDVKFSFMDHYEDKTGLVLRDLSNGDENGLPTRFNAMNRIDRSTGRVACNDFYA